MFVPTPPGCGSERTTGHLCLKQGEQKARIHSPETVHTSAEENMSLKCKQNGEKGTLVRTARTPSRQEHRPKSPAAEWKATRNTAAPLSPNHVLRFKGVCCESSTTCSLGGETKTKKSPGL